jgi:NADH:ubiquinone oxidoreductase subunit F (NADH-binding)
MIRAPARTPPGRRAPTGLPRLLAAYRPDAPMTIDEHLRHYGTPPWRGATRRGGPLINTLDAAGLRGRGGAAFPTARKMRAVVHSRGRPVVVVNGSEGEPLSAKDHLLLASLPHLVLDGAVLAAEAVGADEVIVAVDRETRRSLTSVAHAVADRGAARLDPVPMRLVPLPSRYVAGEETALVNFVNGRPAKPTFTPPRPFEQGVGGRPTLIQNVETLAEIALIARYGADWYRELGTVDEPGSMLATIGGAVARPSVCEISLGTPIRDAIYAVGGATHDISAFLIGGYFGSWLPAADTWDLALTNASLKQRGAALGTGVIYAFPAGHCGLVATARVTRYLAGETAGQCGPCVYGLRAIADAMSSLAEGTHSPHTVRRLHGWFDDVRGRGACQFPDGVIRFVASALDVFGDEVALHDEAGGCRSGAPPALPIPPTDGSWQ